MNPRGMYEEGSTLYHIASFYSVIWQKLYHFRRSPRVILKLYHHLKTHEDICDFLRDVKFDICRVFAHNPSETIVLPYDWCVLIAHSKLFIEDFEASELDK